MIPRSLLRGESMLDWIINLKAQAMMQIRFGLFIAMAILIHGCYDEPVANFIYSTSDVYVPATFSFTNLSTEADSYLWDFGDGNTATTTSPVHTYNDGGTFTVTLKAAGKGGDNTSSQSITLNYRPPVADFSFSYSDNEAPATVSFSNLSTDADQYSWEFGDGNTSTSTSPTHTYNDGGIYSITLTAIGLGGSSTMTKSITITQPAYTSYIVKNSSSVTLYSVMSFYWTGSDIIEDVDHGTLSSGSQSSEVITERLTIDVAFQFYYNGVLTLALVYTPYDLTENELNYLDIDDDTEIYIGSAQAKGINSMKALKEFKRTATPVLLKELIAK